MARRSCRRPIFGGTARQSRSTRTAKRFARIAAQLMGVERVRLYHDQALFKEAGGGITPWHQDQHYWPLATNNTITMWMTLADIDADMGTLQFASGSHADGYLGDIPISDESEAQLKAFVERRGFTLRQADAMAAGSATFHSGWTLHSAPPNFSERMRPAMTLIYFADGRARGRAGQQAPRQRPRSLAAGDRAGRSGGDGFESALGITLENHQSRSHPPLCRLRRRAGCRPRRSYPSRRSACATIRCSGKAQWSSAYQPMKAWSASAKRWDGRARGARRRISTKCWRPCCWAAIRAIIRSRGRR